MSWKPSEKDQKFIELLVSMCADTLIGSGVVNKETFISNLKIICKLMEPSK